MQPTTNPKIMVTTATSSCNLKSSQPIILYSSKSIQTQTNSNEIYTTVHPFYCFSVKDGQVLPIILSSPSSSKIISIDKEITCSLSPFFNRDKVKFYSRNFQKQ